MKTIISNILSTIIYCLVGVLIAIPVSYFFQSDLYEYISFTEYVSDFQVKIMVGNEFGSWNIYRNTAVAMIVLIIVMVNMYKQIKDKSKKLRD